MKTTITVFRSRLKRNLRTIQRAVGHQTRILLVIKDNAYGHGMIPLAQYAQREKLVKYLGVASVDEAIKLRQNKVTLPILVLGTTFVDEYKAVAKYRITPSLSNLDEAAALDRFAKRIKKRIKIHVELDTGMGRLGIWCFDALSFLFQMKRHKHLQLEGIFSHFPDAENTKHAEFSQSQIKIFGKIKELFEELYPREVLYYHFANSAGILNYPQSYMNMVRPGLLAYGICGSESHQEGYKPILELKSVISLIKKIEAGRPISYALSYISPQDTRIAIVPLGYAKGYPWSLSNRSYVLIRGRECPVLGRVTMDQVMVEIGLNTDIKVGDEVVFIGRSKKQEIRVDQLAESARTIPYEILCHLHPDIPRIYKD